MALSPDAFAWVADTVRHRSAIQLPTGKEYLVESRLLPLAKEAGTTDVTAYVAQVRAGNDERVLRRLVEALTTNETSWFRDNSPFVALRQQVLPTLLGARTRPVHLRFWSAACSTGQEPYSLAMTLVDVLPAGVTFEILATDLSDKVLERAASGRYSQLEINRGLPAPLMVRWFTRAGADWEISAELRRRVSFRRHNLLDSPPPGRFDAVLLRNVLIYFDLPTKQAILRRVAGALAADGTLLLGAAETTIGVDMAWERIPVGGGSVYRRADAPAAPGPLRPVPSQLPAPRAAPLRTSFTAPPGAPLTQLARPGVPPARPVTPSPLPRGAAR